MANEAPLVTVVVPNYNYAEFLPKALESVIAQTYPKIEILLVDDGSTDGSREVAAQFGRRLRIISANRGGVAAARNLGIKEAKGAFVAFLDSDDVWDKNKIALQVVAALEPGVGMVYTGLQHIDCDGRPIGFGKRGSSGHDVLADMILMRGPGVPASGSSALVSRQCLELIGGFDEQLTTSADWDLWRRIACRYEIRLLPEPLTRYRFHPRSMHRQVDVFERDMMRCFEKAFLDPYAAAILPLRRRAYSGLFLNLSGSYLQAGQPTRSVQFALRSVIQWPGSLGYILSFPIRRLSRLFNGYQG